MRKARFPLPAIFGLVLAALLVFWGEIATSQSCAFKKRHRWGCFKRSGLWGRCVWYGGVKFKHRMAFNSILCHLLAIFFFAIFLPIPSVSADFDPRKQRFYEMVIVGEGASQGFEGMYGIVCVLRNRNWDTRGFSSAKRQDLQDFYLRQPKIVRNQAAQVVEALYRGGVDTTGYATHFESDRFPEPKWARGMQKTVKIYNHQFYCEPTRRADRLLNLTPIEFLATAPLDDGLVDVWVEEE